MTTRVSPTERIRAEIDELFAGAERGSLLEHFEEVARAAVRLVFQTALEAEVTEFLGRDRYERGERERRARATATATDDQDDRRGGDAATPEAAWHDGEFASRLLGTGVTRTNALESLVIAGFVRGLSVRDVEASLAEALGPESTHLEVDGEPDLRGDQGRVRRLADPGPLRRRARLLLRGRQLLQDAPRRPGRAGARRLGHHHFRQAGVLGPRAGILGESTDAWAGFFRASGPGPARPAAGRLRRRPGPDRRGGDRLRRSLRQRCLIHRARNVLAKVPAHAQAQVKADYWKIFDDHRRRARPGRPGRRPQPGQGVRRQWRKLYPAAVDCLEDDFEHLVTYLRFPAEHWEPHPALQLHRAHLRRDPPAGEGDRPPPWRALLPVARVGRARPGQPRLARCQPEHPLHPPARRTPTRTVRPHPRSRRRATDRRNRHTRRIGSSMRNLRPEAFTPIWDVTVRDKRRDEAHSRADLRDQLLELLELSLAHYVRLNRNSCTLRTVSIRYSGAIIESAHEGRHLGGRTKSK